LADVNFEDLQSVEPGAIHSWGVQLPLVLLPPVRSPPPVREPPPRPGRNWGRAKAGTAAEEAAMRVENFIMNENRMC